MCFRGRYWESSKCIAQKGVRAIDARKSAPRNGSNAANTSVRAPGLSTDECEHPLCDTLGLAEIWPPTSTSDLNLGDNSR